MAGSFGYAREHYPISMAIGERVLLPRARAAAPDDILVADGTTCRHQIRDGAGRRAIHLAELLELAGPR
jgi:Fe-S oxidoreductase